MMLAARLRAAGSLTVTTGRREWAGRYRVAAVAEARHPWRSPSAPASTLARPSPSLARRVVAAYRAGVGTIAAESPWGREHMLLEHMLHSGGTRLASSSRRASAATDTIAEPADPGPLPAQHGRKTRRGKRGGDPEKAAERLRARRKRERQVTRQRHTERLARAMAATDAEAAAAPPAPRPWDVTREQFIATVRGKLRVYDAKVLQHQHAERGRDGTRVADKALLARRLRRLDELLAQRPLTRVDAVIVTGGDLGGVTVHDLMETIRNTAYTHRGERWLVPLWRTLLGAASQALRGRADFLRDDPASLGEPPSWSLATICRLAQSALKFNQGSQRALGAREYMPAWHFLVDAIADYLCAIADAEAALAEAGRDGDGDSGGGRGTGVGRSGRAYTDMTSASGPTLFRSRALLGSGTPDDAAAQSEQLAILASCLVRGGCTVPLVSPNGSHSTGQRGSPLKNRPARQYADGDSCDAGAATPFNGDKALAAVARLLTHRSGYITPAALVTAVRSFSRASTHDIAPTQRERTDHFHSEKWAAQALDAGRTDARASVRILFSALSDAALARDAALLTGLNNHDLVQVAWAMARVRARVLPLMLAIAGEATPRLMDHTSTLGRGAPAVPRARTSRDAYGGDTAMASSHSSAPPTLLSPWAASTTGAHDNVTDASAADGPTFVGQGFTSRQVADLAWAFARLKVRNAGLFRALGSAMDARMLRARMARAERAFDGSDVAAGAAAGAGAAAAGGGIAGASADWSATHLVRTGPAETIAPSDLVRFAWAYTRVDLHADAHWVPPLFKALGDELCELAPFPRRTRGFVASTTAAAFARARVTHAPLFRALGRTARDDVTELSPVELTTLAWACASSALSGCDRQLMPAVLREAQRRGIERFAPHAAATIAWALCCVAEHEAAVASSSGIGAGGGSGGGGAASAAASASPDASGLDMAEVLDWAAVVLERLRRMHVSKVTTENAHMAYQVATTALLRYKPPVGAASGVVVEGEAPGKSPAEVATARLAQAAEAAARVGARWARGAISRRERGLAWRVRHETGSQESSRLHRGVSDALGRLGVEHVNEYPLPINLTMGGGDFDGSSGDDGDGEGDAAASAGASSSAAAVPTLYAYVADAYVPSLGLVLEVDGPNHYVPVDVSHGFADPLDASRGGLGLDGGAALPMPTEAQRLPSSSMKLAHLRVAGFRVATLPYWELNEAVEAGPEAVDAYVQSVLETEGGPRAL